MRLRYIEMFQAVLETGTLTGAARLLNISQPAATKLLRQAERQLGFPLFTRVRGRLRPTIEAGLLRSRIEKISDEVNELRRLAENLKPSVHRVLRIVSTPALANNLVPHVITRLRSASVDVGIEVFTQHSRELLDSILLRESDIGLTLQNTDHPGVHCQPLWEGSVRVIAQRGYWPAGEVDAPMPIEQLAGASVVGIGIRDELGRKLHEHLECLPVAPRISTWVQTYQVARSLVSFGHGLALVDPFTALGAGDDGIQVRPLEPEIPVSLYALYRNDSELSPLQSVLLNNVRDAANMMIRGQAPACSRRWRRDAVSSGMCSL